MLLSPSGRTTRVKAAYSPYLPCCGKVKDGYIFWPLSAAALLLADGIITPSITVVSSIEGLQMINPDIQVVPIVIIILTLLFSIQQFGTDYIGKFFGPIMFFWFLMLGILGAMEIHEQIAGVESF